MGGKKMATSKETESKKVVKKETAKVEPAKAEVKTEAKAETKTAAKAPAKKAATKTTAAKKAPAKKAATKTTATKTAAKKAPAKKAATKAATPEIKTNIVLQYGDKNVTYDTIVTNAKNNFKFEMGGDVDSIKKLSVYVKPEENSAYYVVDDKVQGRIDL